MNKLKLLNGTWLTKDEDSRVQLTISVKNESVTVTACDPYDKEEFAISKVKWDGKSLFFKMKVPSTNYVTCSKITPKSSNRFAHQISFEEIWHKSQKSKKGGGRKTDQA